jgi:hypothetical protein
MLRLSLLGLAAIAFAGPALAAEAYPDGVERTFSAWTVTCDPTHTCWAQAFADNYEMTALSLKRAAGPEAALVASLFGSVDNETFDMPGFEAAFTGAEQGLDTDQGAGGLVIAAAQTGLFVDALRNAATLSNGGTISISLAGASAAMRLIDEVQGRVGTVTALVAKGDKPAGAVPAAPAMPVVLAPNTKALEIAGEPGTDLKAAAIEACGGDDEPEFEPIGVRLDDGREIWLMPCSNGMYNYLYAGLLKDGDAISGLSFTGPAEGAPPLSELEIMWNPEIGTDDPEVNVPPRPLGIFTFGRGRSIGDCGEMTKHVWTGKAFALVSHSTMRHCAGLPYDDWPVRWEAEVKAE